MLPLLLFAAAAASPSGSPADELLNPRAAELFEREPALMNWALRRFDANGDGWLTAFEAQRAADAFREIADLDRDGRVTMAEYRDALSFIVARY